MDSFIHSAACLATGPQPYRSEFPAQCDLLLSVAIYSTFSPP